MKKMLVFLLAFLLPILSAMPAAAENRKRAAMREVRKN